MRGKLFPKPAPVGLGGINRAAPGLTHIFRETPENRAELIAPLYHAAHRHHYTVRLHEDTDPLPRNQPGGVAVLIAPHHFFDTKLTVIGRQRDSSYQTVHWN